MNRLQSHENGSNFPKFYVNSPAINRKFVKIGSHFHEISLRSPNYQTRSKLYCARGRIETMFDMLKNVMGVFRYRFWTKGLPRHSRKPRKNQSMNPAMGIDQKRKVRRCFDAYEQFVMIGAIAPGLLQLISLKYQNSVWLAFQGFLRTRSRNLPSERTVKYVIANLLLLDLFSSAPKRIIREIQKYRFKKKMFKPGVLPDKRVSDPETVLSKLE